MYSLSQVKALGVIIQTVHELLHRHTMTAKYNTIVWNVIHINIGAFFVNARLLTSDTFSILSIDESELSSKPNYVCYFRVCMFATRWNQCSSVCQIHLRVYYAPRINSLLNPLYQCYDRTLSWTCRLRLGAWA